MKKVRILALALAMFASSSLMAQFVVNGQLSLRTTGGNGMTTIINETYNIPADKSSDFTIMPRIGYQMNDKFQLGLGFGYNHSTETEYDIWGANDYNTVKDYWDKYIYSGWMIAPYVRFNFANAGSFNFFAEAICTFAGSGFSKHIDHTPTTENTITGHSKRSAVELMVVPGVNYKFNDMFSMDLYVDLLSLSYSSVTSKNYDDENNNVLSSSTANTFRFAAVSTPETLSSHLGAFRLGFNLHL